MSKENNNNLIRDRKLKYRKRMASMPYEEKVKIIIELQKIDCEFRKTKKSGIKKVWEI